MEQRIEWYLPVSYAAELLGCSRLEIRELIRTGVLRFVRLPGKRIVVSDESIHRYLNAMNPHP